jgi:hypothetical protein
MRSRSHVLLVLKRPRLLLAFAAIGALITVCVYLVSAWVDAEWSVPGVSLLLAGALVMAGNRIIVQSDHGGSPGGAAVTTLRWDMRVRFSTLAEELTKEVVTFEVEKWPPGMERLMLEPVDPGAAPITAVVTDSEVMLNFGLGGYAEVRTRGWSAHSRGLRRIDELCRAVVEGGLEETVYLRGDRVVGSSATLATPTGALKSRTFWLRPRRATSEVVRYAPYTD